jgi:hypothetical protein
VPAASSGPTVIEFPSTTRAVIAYHWRHQEVTLNLTRESFLLVVAVNLVLSLCVFAVAFAVLSPANGSDGPTGLPVGAEVESLRRTVDSLTADLEKARADREALRNELLAMTGRVGTLEASPPGGGQGAVFVSEGEPIEITPEMRMMIGFASVMLKGRVKREKDRFFDDVMNPTERSEARKKRGIQRAVRHLKNRIDLSDQEAEQVTRILTELEDGRRATLKSLIETKENRDDVEYDEVKRILEDSFVEEDRMIMQTLPPEKVVAYQETAEPFRQVIFGVAKMAFPEPKEEK